MAQESLTPENNHGGKREGAGRKPGIKTSRTEQFTKRITPQEKQALEDFLVQYRLENKE